MDGMPNMCARITAKYWHIWMPTGLTMKFGYEEQLLFLFSFMSSVSFNLMIIANYHPVNTCRWPSPTGGCVTRDTCGSNLRLNHHSMPFVAFPIYHGTKLQGTIWDSPFSLLKILSYSAQYSVGSGLSCRTLIIPMPIPSLHSHS